MFARPVTGRQQQMHHVSKQLHVKSSCPLSFRRNNSSQRHIAIPLLVDQAGDQSSRFMCDVHGRRALQPTALAQTCCHSNQSIVTLSCMRHMLIFITALMPLLSLPAADNICLHLLSLPQHLQTQPALSAVANNTAAVQLLYPAVPVQYCGTVLSA